MIDNYIRVTNKVMVKDALGVPREKFVHEIMCFNTELERTDRFADVEKFARENVDRMGVVAVWKPYEFMPSHFRQVGKELGHE